MPGVNQPLSDDAEIFATVTEVEFLAPSNLPGFEDSATKLPAGTYVVRKCRAYTSSMPDRSVGIYEVLENRHMRAAIWDRQLRALTPMEHLALTGE